MNDHELDQALAAHFAPPELPPGFRAELMKRVARERRAAWVESLPNALTVLAIAGSACFLPAYIAIGVGLGLTATMYFSELLFSGDV